MRIILTTVLISIVFTANIYGQTGDSSKVKQVNYSLNPNKAKTDIITEQQMKAKHNYDKGESLIEKHEFEKAIKQLNKAIEIDSTGNCGTGRNGIAYRKLGYVYKSLDDYENAITYLNKAIEIDKFIATPYISKTVILMQQKNNELAFQTFDSLIKYVPDYAMAYVQRGSLYHSTKQYELAIKDLNSYIEIIEEQNQKKKKDFFVEIIKKQIKEIEKKIEE